MDIIGINDNYYYCASCCFLLKKDVNSKPSDTSKDDALTYKFKIFEFPVPKGLKFSSYDDRRFRIDGNGWYAIVGIWYDEKKTIYDNIAAFQEAIKKNAKISNSDVVMIDDVKVITFQNEPSKSLMCYFATNFRLDYEIEIFNADGSYKTDALKELIGPLLYVTHEDVASYDSYAGYFILNNADKNTSGE